MTDAPKQTRLGYRLREAVGRMKPEDFPALDVLGFEVLQKRALQAAAVLDRSVFALGRKGEGIKSMRSYRDAAKIYGMVAGKAYVA